MVAGIICRKDCSNPTKDGRETGETSRKRVQVLLLSWYVVQEDPASFNKVLGEKQVLAAAPDQGPCAVVFSHLCLE